MSSSSVVSNHPVTNPDRSKSKKKKKSSQRKEDPTRNHIKWKSEAQQQYYSSKLIQALNQVTIGSSSSGSSAASSSGAVSAPPSAPKRGRAVREAADRALAVAAKGRSRWSRAILTNRLKLKFRKQKRQKVLVPPAAAVTGSGRSRKQRFSVLKLKGKSLPSMQRKVRVLGRLVPGCRKQPLPVILEEATDYIAALEMQVRAMTALTELLSVGVGSSSGGAAAASPPTS